MIAENLPDEARAPKLIVGLKSQVRGEREAEVAKRPARQVGQRQPHGPGRGASRHPVAIQMDGRDAAKNNNVWGGYPPAWGRLGALTWINKRAQKSSQ